jgi:hypothetical protein
VHAEGAFPCRVVRTRYLLLMSLPPPNPGRQAARALPDPQHPGRRRRRPGDRRGVRQRRLKRHRRRLGHLWRQELGRGHQEPAGCSRRCHREAQGAVEIEIFDRMRTDTERSALAAGRPQLINLQPNRRPRRSSRLREAQSRASAFAGKRLSGRKLTKLGVGP